jgi:hypothetical protein
LLVQCGAPTTSQLAVNLFPDSYGPDGRVNTPRSDREPGNVHEGETNQIPEEFLAITDHSILLIPTEAMQATVNESVWTASGMGGLSTNWGGTSGVTMAQAYTSSVGSNAHADGLGADAERSKLSMGYISYFVKYDNVSMGENQFIVTSPQSLSYYLNGCPNYNAGETSQNMDWVCPTKTVNAGTFKFSVIGMLSGSQINSGATASFAQTSLFPALTNDQKVVYRDINNYKTMLYRSTLDVGGMGDERKLWVTFENGTETNFTELTPSTDLSGAVLHVFGPKRGELKVSFSPTYSTGAYTRNYAKVVEAFGSIPCTGVCVKDLTGFESAPNSFPLGASLGIEKLGNGGLASLTACYDDVDPQCHAKLQALHFNDQDQMIGCDNGCGPEQRERVKVALEQSYATATATPKSTPAELKNQAGAPVLEVTEVRNMKITIKKSRGCDIKNRPSNPAGEDRYGTAGTSWTAIGTEHDCPWWMLATRWNPDNQAWVWMHDDQVGSGVSQSDMSNCGPDECWLIDFHIALEDESTGQRTVFGSPENDPVRGWLKGTFFMYDPEIAGRVASSLVSSTRVVGQLGADNLEQKVLANMATVYILVGVLLFALLVCIAGRCKLQKHQRQQSNAIAEVSKRMTKEERRVMNARIGGKLSRRTGIERDATTSKVLERLAVDFWIEYSLKTIVAWAQKKGTTTSKEEKVNEGKHATPNDENDENDENDQQPPPQPVSTTNRCWTRFKENVAMQHEFLSPLALRAHDRFFTVVDRTMLLTLMLFSQTAVQALMFDFNNPETKGTCSVNNLTTTVNMTSNTVVPSSIAPKLFDQLTTAIVSAALTVPIALFFFNSLMQLAWQRRNVRMFQRYGIHQLIAHGDQRKLSGTTLSWAGCGTVAFLKVDKKMITLTWKSQVRMKKQGRDNETVLLLESVLVHDTTTTRRSSTRKSVVKKLEVPLSSSVNESELNQWLSAVMESVSHLPRCRHASAVACSVAKERCVYLESTRAERTLAATQNTDHNGAPLMAKESTMALEKLRGESREYYKHSMIQKRTIFGNGQQEKKQPQETRERGHSLFALPDQMFTRKVRRKLLLPDQWLKEEEEDLAGKHLKKDCCCRMLFGALVLSDRAPVEDEGWSMGKKVGLYVSMVVLCLICALYVLLFGLCHGQESTLVWFQSLLLSIAVSAVVFRPVTILLVTGLFPTLVIEAGLRGGDEGKGKVVAMSSNEIEMIEVGNPPNQQHDLFF